MNRLVWILTFALLTSFLLWAESGGGDPIIKIEERIESIYSDQQGLPAERFDTSGDGSVDYILISDSEGEKLYELLDYNRDGRMDDICIYRKGLLSRREIDSNHDGRFDIWLKIKDGSFLEQLEQDLDFDGVVDKHEQYGEED